MKLWLMVCICIAPYYAHSQMSHNGCESYLRVIYNNTKFYNKTFKVYTLKNLLQSINDKKRSAYYINIDSTSYVGVLNNFFEQGKRKKNVIDNQNKYLFIYSERNNISVLFLNTLSNDKSIIDSLQPSDLFMTNKTIEAYVFDHNHQLLKIFNVYPSNSGRPIRIQEYKKNNKTFLKRTIISFCNIYYEDFIKSSLNDIVNHSNCILSTVSKFKIIEDWNLVSNPYKNFFIRQWSKSSKH